MLSPTSQTAAGLALCIIVSSCGESVSPDVSANGLWTYEMSVASGDTTCSIADAFLAFDDTTGRTGSWGLLDALLDCHFPPSPLNGLHQYGFYVDGDIAPSGVDVSAFLPTLTLRHTGVYTGNNMSGSAHGDLLDNDGNEAHMDGHWSARRDTQSESLLTAMQGAWTATDYRVGPDTTNLVLAGWTYELTFTGRHAQYRTSTPDGGLSSGGRDLTLQHGILWLGTKATAAPFYVTLPTADRLLLRRDSQISLGSPTIRITMTRSSSSR